MHWYSSISCRSRRLEGIKRCERDGMGLVEEVDLTWLRHDTTAASVVATEAVSQELKEGCQLEG